MSFGDHGSRSSASHTHTHVLADLAKVGEKKRERRMLAAEKEQFHSLTDAAGRGDTSHRDTSSCRDGKRDSTSLVHTHQEEE